MTEQEARKHIQKLKELEEQISTAAADIRKELDTVPPELWLCRPKKQNLPPGITLRKDGRYMARFMYRGQNYVLYDMNLESLQNKFENLKYEVKSGLYRKEPPVTTDTWFQIWMADYKRRQVKPTTCRVYEICYNTHIRPYIGGKNLRDILPQHLQQILNAECENTGQRTLSGIRTVMNMLFSQAYKNGLIRQNPVVRTVLPVRRPDRERRVLTKEEQNLFLRRAKASKYGSLFEIALFTGMRSGEIRALEWKDIDFEKKVIHINGTLSYLHGKYYKATPKTRSSRRDIPMSDRVSRILKRQRSLQEQLRQAAGSAWQNQKEALVFTTETGNYLSANTLLYHIRQIQKQIRKEYPDWEPIHPHTLRHTFATRAIEGGMEPQTLKVILGHSSLSMTMDLYSHVLPDTKAAQMKKIEKMF